MTEEDKYTHVTYEAAMIYLEGFFTIEELEEQVEVMKKRNEENRKFFRRSVENRNDLQINSKSESVGDGGVDDCGADES